MAEETNETPAATEVFRLKFLMRSGNFFTVDGVTGFEMKKNGLGQFTSLTLKQADDPRHTYVFVPSIDLAQIEAIIRLPDDQVRRLAVLGDPDGRQRKGERS
ncbi:hypothetical protein JRF84_08180 [Methylobacterium organophilum]|uniref:hypothetical protein n=1 Tax=Methylobacterium TaxID=407 RepID=UPI0019CFB8CF|nr:hypothetical protein [Methylobacterium organophilum]MBN6819566.1 hypothetical protein [Methylobacterium organophilum]